VKHLSAIFKHRISDFEHTVCEKVGMQDTCSNGDIPKGAIPEELAVNIPNYYG
jgi:hypothetical protein